MDCRTARFLLDLARPHAAEVHPEEASALDAHLAGCPVCESLAQTERQADDRLGQAMRNVPLPEGLRDRLLSRLDADERVRRRRRALRLGAPAALAAAVLLAVGVWLYFNSPKLPPVDVEYQAMHFAAKKTGQEASPQQVEDWFLAKHQMAIVAPRGVREGPLNYALLSFFDLVVVEPGKPPVPMLQFVRGDRTAEVYVYNRRKFDLKELDEEFHFDSHGVIAQVSLCPTDPNITYVVIIKGGSIEPFLTGVANPG